MELTERELLIKIEQQLKSLSESHREVLSEISLLFEKQDRDSKLLAVLTSEFKSHTEHAKINRDEMSKQCVLNRDEITKRISKSEGHIEKLFNQLETTRLSAANIKSELQNSIQGNTSKLEANVNDLDNRITDSENILNTKITQETNDRKTFETTLKAYVKSSKIFISIIAFLITLITSIVYPLIVALIKHKLLGN